MKNKNHLSLSFETHRGLIVHPLMPGSAKLRLLLPDASSSVHFHHYRSRHGSLFDVFQIMPVQFPDVAEQHFEEPVIYGGPLFHHFGHLIAESIHRIWPRLTHVNMSGMKVVFHPTPTRRGYLTTLPDWMFSVLSYMGLGLDDILFIDRPTYFGQLIVPQQARGQTFPCTDPNYSDIFPLVPWSESITDENKSKEYVYFSRSNYLYSGSYLGEKLVENVLKDAGFTIVYPEHWDVKDLVAVFCQASVIVFSEGSAIHILELCGRLKARIYIICRRSADFVSTVFGGLLSEFVEHVELVQNIETLTPLDWDGTKGIPAFGNASAIIDIVSLLKRIGTENSLVIRFPSLFDIRQAQRNDLLRLILDEKSTKSSIDTKRLGELLMKLRVQCRDHDLLTDV